MHTSSLQQRYLSIMPKQKKKRNKVCSSAPTIVSNHRGQCQIRCMHCKLLDAVISIDLNNIVRSCNVATGKHTAWDCMLDAFLMILHGRALRGERRMICYLGYIALLEMTFFIYRILLNIIFIKRFAFNSCSIA